MRIILASASPRRKELLTKLLNKYGLSYEVCPNDVNEEEIEKEEKNPVQLVEKLSYLKAKAIFEKENGCDEDLIVIGADTTVYFEGEILGKPKDRKDAISMLAKIQGKTNKVYTGMTIFIKCGNNFISKTVHSESIVYMKNMSEKDIIEYVNTKDPLDKAGAYAIQGIGSKYIEKYEGSYNSVVGLNIELLEEILKERL